MEPRTFRFAVESCPDAVFEGDDDAVFQQIVTDSRKVGRGDLFLALRGERFDGHDFAEETLERGAAGIVVEREWRKRHPGLFPALVVEDTTSALNRIAARYRRDFNLPIVAIAGSNGKTSVKELLAATLRQERKALWSRASFNNHIGVPLTLLELDSDRQAAVLEVGTNHPGELRGLLESIAPHYGILTSIGREHLEHFGDLDGVAEEEGTLGEMLPADGRFFVNGDTPLVDRVVARCRAEAVRVGLGPNNAWRAIDVETTSAGTTFRAQGPDPAYRGDYRLALLGKHHAVNALFAIAVGAELGVSPEGVRRGLADCQPAPMRLESKTVGDVTVINDAYNANADSAVAALQTLDGIRCSGRRILVLGDMAELGEHSRAAHAEVGRFAAEIGADALLTVGEASLATSEAARAAGLADATHYNDWTEMAAAANAMKGPGDVFLVKASRAARLERVAEALHATTT